jgi:hypothetical protein
MIMKIRTNLTLAMFLTCACYAQNLLTNGDFSSGNIGFSSGYSYVPSGVSQTPGTYGIQTNSQSFNPAYALFYDHTSGNGNMLLLDGSPGTTTIAWSETVSVMTNAQYTYSSWTTSSDPYNMPTLQFSINGIQVGSEITLSINSGQWQQFLVVWNSDATNSATLSMVDENPTGYTYGNDFALDDFSFSLVPSLSVALSSINSVAISWPSPSTGYVLQQNADLTTTNWTNCSFLVNDNGTTKSVTNSTPAGNLFFRLSQP